MIKLVGGSGEPPASHNLEVPNGVYKLHVCRNKEEWDKAIVLLKTLKEQFPEYLPSYTWLTWIYTHTQRYDEAMEVVSQLPEQYTDLANNITADIWRYKRINQRRIEKIPEIDNI